MNIFALLLAIVALSGCAHNSKILEVSCMPSADATKSKGAQEITGPLIMNGGELFYYGDDGLLHRVKEATCGVR